MFFSDQIASSLICAPCIGSSVITICGASELDVASSNLNRWRIMVSAILVSSSANLVMANPAVEDIEDIRRVEREYQAIDGMASE